MKDVTTLCSLKGDKPCAVTFTADDNLYRTSLFYLSRFKQYGLRGTLMFTTDFIIPSHIGMVTEENGFATLEQWREFLKEGCFDIGNHTKSHPFLDKVTPEQLQDEINVNQARLREMFPGQKIVSLANPYVVTNEDIDTVVAEQHYSARNGQGGYNSLDPDEKKWFRLDFQNPLHDSTAEWMNTWVDEAIEKKVWLIEMWHGVDGVSWEPPASEECDKHLYYLSRHLDKVWNGTMEEVTLYIRERQHATVSTELCGDSEMRVTLSHDLDPVLFDYPLTLKTEVPSQWKAVMLIHDGREETLQVSYKDGTCAIYYDVVPNKGPVIIRPITE